ncbi:DNA alkylation repair protein [Bacillus salitolerans]|uniref:DNA alkylation repair protein n=1 Tax=Bacillus salitolerans TaxID=1437434 RepID=A0ABW4LPS4_9BACI
MTNPYVSELVNRFSVHQNREEADRMSQYMRRQFLYFGLRAPQMREITKLFLKDKGYPRLENLSDCIFQLYALPERELQIAALYLMDYKIKEQPDITDIETIEYLITNKSWWDTVDHIAQNHAGVYFKKFPEMIRVYSEKWLQSDNIWLKRTAILFQLKYKEETDEELLFSILSRSIGTKEFFINKAIGWALREYSKVNKEAVIAFIYKYDEQLANLSKREGLKWLKSRELI